MCQSPQRIELDTSTCTVAGIFFGGDKSSATPPHGFILVLFGEFVQCGSPTCKGRILIAKTDSGPKFLESIGFVTRCYKKPLVSRNHQEPVLLDERHLNKCGFHIYSSMFFLNDVCFVAWSFVFLQQP